MAEYVVQNATLPVYPLVCMPRLLLERRILKSRMNRGHVRHQSYLDAAIAEIMKVVDKI